MNALNVERYNGGGTLMLGAAGVGLLGLLLTFVGMVVSPEVASHAYLIAFLYWLGLALAALILISVFHASGARWMVVLRRPLETIAVTAPLFLLLFIPIVLGREPLFGAWLNMDQADPNDPLTHHLHHKHAYLNLPFFLIRAVIYFGVWIGVGHLQHRWSLAQDETGEAAFTLKQRRLGAGSLPFLALTMTFAAFDWIMSLHPLWFSTIFGVYYFAGSFLGIFCLLTLVTTFARGEHSHGRLVTPHHFHNLGKLMLAFTVFWAYIGYSQYMLIWLANLPESVGFYTVRAQGAWRSLAIFLLFGHFIVPFLVLLSRKLKLLPRALSVVAVWLLLMHWVDLYWLVMPAVHPQNPWPHWTHLTAFIGVGGVSVAFGLFRARGRFAVPVRDPYLPDSLGYVQP